MTTLPEVKIWTDGSGTTAGNPGGWAAVIHTGNHRTEISGGMLDATNNRAELTAVIMAMGEIKQPSRVEIYTDSQYVSEGVSHRLVRWASRNYRKSVMAENEIANADLWRKLKAKLNGHRVFAIWIPRASHPENVRCDKLAGHHRKEAKKTGTEGNTKLTGVSLI